MSVYTVISFYRGRCVDLTSATSCIHIYLKADKNARLRVGTAGKERVALNKELAEIMECTCLRMRRASRRMTQIYDHKLGSAGLTINQFGLLAQLYGVNLGRSAGLAVGALAERLGTDPTTLNRTLKPLEARGLVSDSSDPDDGRARIVRITDKGQRELLKAVPLWRQAQAQVEKALGSKSMRDLNKLLDFSSGRLPQQA
jgi:DNA-binding MarR family transcriptional regulator